MENMLLVGLSRQMTLRRQMDVVANNIANINTTGFKAERTLFEEYLSPTAREDNFVAGRDRRVSFVQDRATMHDFAGGPVEQTKNPLDVAIDGNAFLVVQTPAGERYTRDGGLQINNLGQLVNASGRPVLGTNGPIVFQQTDHDINISQDGTVTVLEGTNRIDSVRGKIRMVRFDNPRALSSEGTNMFASAAAPLPAGPEARLEPGAIEGSNVKAVIEMTRLMEVQRSYQSTANMMSKTDELRTKAIARLADQQA